MGSGRVLIYRLQHYVWLLHLRVLAGDADRQYLCPNSALRCQVAMELAAAMADNNHSIVWTQRAGIVDKLE
jgi:hypothetical protein